MKEVGFEGATEEECFRLASEWFRLRYRGQPDYLSVRELVTVATESLPNGGVKVTYRDQPR